MGYIILYVVVVFLATIIGSITGLGGGVIIKPLFDLISLDTAQVISIYSSIAVFTMSVVNVIKQRRQGFKYNYKLLLTISSGALLGGYIGEFILSFALANYTSSQITIIQSILLSVALTIILIFNLLNDRMKHYRLEGLLKVFLLGLCLGSISVFIGIGGGPLNVTVFMFLFSFSMKESAIYSLAVIFFSQLSKILTILLNGTISEVNYIVLPLIMITAIIGGIVGTNLSHEMSNEKVKRYFIWLLIALIAVSVFNIIRYSL